MSAADTTLLAGHDALLLDLDGTVYRGGEAVPGAKEAVRVAREAGVGVRFVTNNASRGPQDVAEHLSQLGIETGPAEVSTSAQAAAGVLARQVSPGAAVLVVGTEALVAEVRAVGLTPVRTASPDVVAVVQGLSQDAGWRDLAEACLAIRAGALWVASNLDPTLPTDRGQLPGNGALVAALRTATGATPIVAGKPARPLMADAIAAAGASTPLAIGDRLDTDIAGAVTVGIAGLLVLTGVSTPADLLAAPPEQRPDYVAADLDALTRPAAEIAIAAQPDWSVEPAGDGVLLRFTGTDPDNADALAALRTLCAGWWALATDRDPDVRPADDTARTALAELGLTRS